MPLLKKDGVDYYEAQLATDVQLKEAERLSRLNHLFPLSYRQITDFLSYNSEGDPEGWLLFSFEKRLTYQSWGNLNSYGTTRYSGYDGCSHPPMREGYGTQQYHAMLLLRGDEGNPFGFEGNPDPCPKIAVHALCCDPWADMGIVAAWTNLRLESLSGVLGGALELEVEVSETNVALQKALRALGYYASYYEKDLDYHPSYDVDPKKKVVRLSGRSMGTITFSRLLRLRPRQDLGKQFLSPRKKTR